LLSAIGAVVPAGRCKAFEVGCGPGTTTIAVADRWPDLAITACDISAALARIAEHRTAGRANVRVVTGDAESLAGSEGPFDLFFSRHGVMFFADPIRAFKSFRRAANPGASLVFSCFQSWDLNPWACEVANAVAARVLPSPGREPSGFAFAEPDYVLDILNSSGWAGAEATPIAFRYVAGEADDAVENAFSFLADLGPASRVLQSLPEEQRAAALDRMRRVVEQHFDGKAVTFDAAAWIWRATAS
jgi:SAM-dependent methyltransferase